jgi:tetratricopeptide (TPR) repeat protein
MSEKSNSFNLTLKGNEEVQLVQLFNSFADENGHLNLSEFIYLAFDKRMISNSTPLYSMLSIFQQAAGDKPYLNKDRFFFAVNLLGRALFPDEIMPLELILTRILSEIRGDPPLFDIELKVLLSEGILRLFEQVEEGFLQILMTYNAKNISNGRRVVGIQQIKMKNLGISARNLLRYFKMKGNVLPAVISVEGLQKILEEVVPPKDMFSRKFFSYGFLLKFYDKDSKTMVLSQLEEIKGEPELRLSDLQLIFGKIAIIGLPTVEDPFERVHYFLENKLFLLSQPKLDLKYSLDLKSDSSLSSMEDPKEILKKHKETKYVKVNTIKESVDLSSLLPTTPPLPSFEELEKVFDDERVPQIPELSKTIQENPPPYALPPIQYPIKPVPASSDLKSSPKKDSKNRAETPGIKVKFASMPGAVSSISPQRPRYESFAEIRKNLNSSLFPENAKQMMSNPAIQPCLIREVFIPPPCPASIRALIESCFVYQSKGEYKSAIMSLIKARKDWLKLENSEFLKADFELFFEMSKGAVYELCKKDELALAQYFSCKVLCDRLSFNHPDRALLYCGLASALSHLGQFKLATRSFLMAKKIRERCIGGDTIETATVYNNLGVCMYNLARYQEAFAYFELSEAIFMMMLGPNHARTLTVKQNINKVKRQNLLATPDFKVLWAKQFQDPFPKSKKKKGKGKKKKGKKG